MKILVKDVKEKKKLKAIRREEDFWANKASIRTDSLVNNSRVVICGNSQRTTVFSKDSGFNRMALDGLKTLLPQKAELT